MHTHHHALTPALVRDLFVHLHTDSRPILAEQACQAGIILLNAITRFPAYAQQLPRLAVRALTQVKP